MTTKQFQLFKIFTARMENEMKANEYKGDWLEFTDKNKIIGELNDHLDKLNVAKLTGNTELIKEYSADLAIISMFMYNSATRDTPNIPQDSLTPTHVDIKVTKVIKCNVCKGRGSVGRSYGRSPRICFTCKGSGMIEPIHINPNQ